MERAYSDELEAYAADNPQDSEAWFALSTSLGRCEGSPLFEGFEPDAAALDRAIRIEAKPLYLMVAARDADDMSQLTAADPDNAFAWWAAASLAIKDNVDGLDTVPQRA